MLHETRKYIEDNFEVDSTIRNSKIYTKSFTGYWKIVVCLVDNYCDILMDSKWELLILSKDKYMAHQMLQLFNRFYKRYSKLFNTQKIKPKRLNEKEIAILVDKVKEIDSLFGMEVKKLKMNYNLAKLNSDF
jgi:hypothetical protein